MTKYTAKLALGLLVAGFACAHAPEPTPGAETATQRELRIRASLRALAADPNAKEITPWLDEAEQWMADVRARPADAPPATLAWVAIDNQLSRARAALSRREAERAQEILRERVVTRQSHVAELKRWLATEAM